MNHQDLGEHLHDRHGITVDDKYIHSPLVGLPAAFIFFAMFIGSLYLLVSTIGPALIALLVSMVTAVGLEVGVRYRLITRQINRSK